MNNSPVTFPSTISTKNFSNFLGTCEPSCLFPREFCFVFRSSRLQTPATHRTKNAVHSGLADKGLNLRRFTTQGIFGIFMNKVFLHLHLQFVSLYTSSDLRLNSLHSQFDDFLWLHTRAQQRRKVITRWTSYKTFRLLSILQSSEFCSVLFKAEVPHCSVGSCSCHIHCEPCTESQPRSHIDANFDGLSIAAGLTRIQTHSRVCTTP